MRIPRATYRVQLNSAFGFDEIKGIVPYLAALGISDVYASPIFKARRGSPHGYDVVDPTELNSELGAVSDFEGLSEELKHHRMGWLQDIVPNHMAFDQENQMLMDVLENGRNSEYFHFFDIDWDHPDESMKGKLLAPFLGRSYRDSLEDGEIRLKYNNADFTLHYYNLVLPLKVESYVHLLTHRFEQLERGLGDNHPDLIELLGILDTLKALPSRQAVKQRHEQTESTKRALWKLYNDSKEIRKFINENIRVFNGEKGNPGSFSLLNDLLSDQLYRLSFWKAATEEIDYRRFFGINDLVSLRMEDEDVFKHAHSLIFELVEQGRITGLRIDHIDGLHDPTSYLQRVAEKAGTTYVVVEKILGLEEELPSFWPVQGTTGYDFMNYVNGVFCKRENEECFSRIYQAIGGPETAYENLVYKKKRLIMERHMTGDIDNLIRLLKPALGTDRRGSDTTIDGLKRALVEVMAEFPVYRTYVGTGGSRETDYLYIKRAVDGAIRTNPGLSKELGIIERILLLAFDDGFSEEDKDQWIQFALRFQQFTGPLMAKGFEDTTLYVYNRLLSLNEVGGNPIRFGISRGEFHRFNERRVNLWPHSLNATATHDTKRGEDTRARINVLSEIPKDWERNVRTWSRINRGKKREVGGRRVPDRNDEYSLYQTLIGAFPFRESEHSSFIERTKAYVIKAAREAKVHTAWLNPDPEYESAFVSFVEELLNPTGANQFQKQFLPFQKRISYYGIFNSLSQTLIKITSPGVPDFYQGTELWDLSLVDPDNRRPVDYERRKSLLREIETAASSDILKLINELLCTKEDGRIKLFLIWRALKARNENSEVFQKGAYIPLEVSGRFKEQIIAFARGQSKKWAVTVAPRFLTALINEGGVPLGQETWFDTNILLPRGIPHLWRNQITNQFVTSQKGLMIGETLEHFPVALLMNAEDK